MRAEVDDETLGWLLEGDPAIRWRTLSDLTDASEAEVARERSRVATEGWGARLLAEQGAGLEIHTTKVTGDNVRASLQRLLTEPRFTERATALRDEMFALPTPNELVHQLEELTTKHRTS